MVMGEIQIMVNLYRRGIGVPALERVKFPWKSPKPNKTEMDDVKVNGTVTEAVVWRDGEKYRVVISGMK